ncbi:hypothetical protein MMC25_005966 [Agyrium rufum]|nr:hypothetical protein [Agyrium rufum]
MEVLNLQLSAMDVDRPSVIFQLPRKVRDLIYFHCLVRLHRGDEYMMVAVQQKNSTTSSTASKHMPPEYMALALSCREIHAEIEDYFLKSCVLMFDRPQELCRQCDCELSVPKQPMYIKDVFHDLLTPARARRIRDLEFSTSWIYTSTSAKSMKQVINHLHKKLPNIDTIQISGEYGDITSKLASVWFVFLIGLVSKFHKLRSVFFSFNSAVRDCCVGCEHDDPTHSFNTPGGMYVSSVIYEYADALQKAHKVLVGPECKNNINFTCRTPSREERSFIVGTELPHPVHDTVRCCLNCAMGECHNTFKKGRCDA